MILLTRPGSFLVLLFLLAVIHSQAQDAAPKPEPPTQEVNKPSDSPSGSGQVPVLSPVPSTPFAQGLAFFRAQEFGAAAEKFKLAATPDTKQSAIAYAWLTRALLHLGKVSEAQAAAQKALQADKDLVDAQSAQGEVDFRLAKMKEAEETFKTLIQVKNADARTYLGMGEIYAMTANYKNAKLYIDFAHKLDPYDPDISGAWVRTLPRKEKLVEFKRLFEAGRFEDEGERTGLANSIAILEDREKNPERACKLTTKVVTAETKLEPLLDDPKHLRGYRLPVNLNGVNSVLLVDTGAGGILVNSRIAEKAGLTKLNEQRIGGIGDKDASRGYIAFAQKIRIGDLEFANCYVDVIEKKSSLGEDGLIGSDVFQDFLVDLDFPNRKLRLSQLPPFPDQASQGPALGSDDSSQRWLHNRFIPPEFANYDRSYRFGHMLLLQAKVNDAPYKLFLLDTGSWDNTITPTAAREATKVYSDDSLQVNGLSGKINKVYTTGVVTLSFSHFMQQRRDLTAFDLTHLSDDVGTEISGTLGFAMLYMLEIRLDYRDHLVDFHYDPARFH